MSRPPELDELLQAAVERRASDIHLTAGLPPVVRIDGALTALDGYEDELDADWVGEAVLGTMSRRHRGHFEETSEVDFSYAIAGGVRFRVNAYLQRTGVAAAFRLIPATAPTLEQYRIPEIARDLALRPSGLVLITGPTGSGKSATLTAMVDIINNERAAHVITIEDPVEYLHTSRNSLIHQREIGADTASFADALRYVLRQDPDVILLGELRDIESITVALSAAETGQLVLATLHTQSAASTINRIVDVFSADRQQQVRAQLADTLRGVISQRLIPRATGRGRVLATEVLIQTHAISNLIREGQVQQLYSVLYAGSDAGMHTMDQSLRTLIAAGEVEYGVARSFVTDPKALDDVRVVDSDLNAETWTRRPQTRWGA
ncbi:type IV pilus twitching motility protein PilT [Microbacterium sp. No. 7]|uniref:type IV pilus twitching motility protein PilT n=1 Tax=Microbacterium sp. No. 7 TaxID=1714373 RepID=UPI0006ECD3BC|nr:type IV pilus twitching motility protein PilT [Microbacterium sp. No. 7]ALJ18746.1 hypothetical protein AOA12_01985 [Microbacterium sp. No. 7]